jgi:hypothetical protein
VPGVFISYRRDDTKGFAGALLRDFNKRIGSDLVFMDTEDIQGGTDFPSVLVEAVKSSEVVLALVGPRWLEARNAAGQLRLEDPEDFVRQEILLALQCDKRVIPVLVDGARMPAADQLPAALRPLATRNAMELSNSRWDEDVARLADHVREGMYAVGVQQAAGARLAADFAPTPPMSRNVKIVVAAFLGFGLLFGGIGLALAMAQSRFEAHALRAEGQVVELLKEPSSSDSAEQGSGAQVDVIGDDANWVYRPVVRFAAAGGQTITFRSATASRPPAYDVGDRVPVLYDANDPGKAQIDSVWQRLGVLLMFLGFGAVFFVIGATPLGVRAARRWQLRGLLRDGRPVIAAFHSVEENTRLTVQGRHPYFVVAEWRNPVSKELVRFRSRQVWDDPTERARNRMITVVVDPNNFRRYIMDLSFLKTDAARPEARYL